MQNVVILGSTGSIGGNTLNVLRLHPDKYKVLALTANSNWQALLTQCVEFKPQYALLLDTQNAANLQQKLVSHHLKTAVLTGIDDLVKLVGLPEVDVVMSAIVGSAGLLPTHEAILAGKKVLLANKEALVTGGKLIQQALARNKAASLIPVDSEHSAIFQALPHGGDATDKSVRRIILTASGGPFRTHTVEQLQNVTPNDAIKHPNWNMGKKISVDSSTLMNKGLEVIEAYWLFDQTPLEVIVHPQSIIHSMVEYIDGSIIAQMGVADMKTPIAYALAYPERITSGSEFLDFNTIREFTFEAPDYVRFPCLSLAFNALRDGGAMPAVLNAANEVAVDLFLHNKITYPAIHRTIVKTMEQFHGADFNSIAEIMEIDTESRKCAYSVA